MNEICLTMLCPPVLEEKLMDMLLIAPEVVVLTSVSAAVHGVPIHQMSQAEQVLGRARFTQIQVLLEAADKTSFLDSLRRQFSGTGLRYWITPVLEQGELA